MGWLMNKYRDDIRESLTLLYQERDRIRRAHRYAKKSIREDVKTGKMMWLEGQRIIRKMKQQQQESMDSLFDKIRERKRVLERLDAHMEGRQANERTSDQISRTRRKQPT